MVGQSLADPMTTPTIVVADRKGVVRLYHPGKMTLAELEAAIKPLL